MQKFRQAATCQPAPRGDYRTLPFFDRNNATISRLDVYHVDDINKY
jgi:hypothetical protein